MGDLVYSSYCVGLAAGSQQATGAAVNHALEGAIHIPAHVKRAVKSYLERTRQLNEIPGSGSVHCIVGRKNSQYHSIGTPRLGILNVLSHDIEFVIGVHEIPAARTDNDKQVDAYGSANGANQAGAWSDAAFAERTA